MPPDSTSKPEGARRTAPSADRLLHQLVTAGARLARRARLGREEAVLELGYRMILQRVPDDHGRRDYLPKLTSGELSVEGFGASLLGSQEFERLWLGRDLGHSLHRSRCEFVRSLPPARRILDLGGTNLQHEWGAMVTMGYPYAFDELVIVDLPPDERHPLYNRGGVRDVVDTPLGPVRYAYHSMEDLSAYPDASVDLVYSGQSIEHVPSEVADTMLADTFRVLRPGGSLAVDTPNAAVTRIQQEAFIDPDHKVEYTLDEVVDKIAAAGFDVVERKGLNLARDVVASGHFDEQEVARNVGVYADARSCYLLALVARRP